MAGGDPAAEEGYRVLDENRARVTTADGGVRNHALDFKAYPRMDSAFFNTNPTDDPSPDTINAASGTSPSENGMTSTPVRTMSPYVMPTCR